MSQVDVFSVLAPDDLRAIADSLEAFNSAMFVHGDYSAAANLVTSANVVHPEASERQIGQFIDTGDGWYGFQASGWLGSVFMPKGEM